MKIDISTQSLNDRVRMRRTDRILEKDTSLLGQWGKNLDVTSGESIRRAEIRNACDYTGVNLLSTLRTGTFSITNQLDGLQVIPDTFINVCVSCNMETIEDVQHLLLGYIKYNSISERCIPIILSLISGANSEISRHRLIKKLLERRGISHLAGRSRERDLVLLRTSLVSHLCAQLCSLGVGWHR